MLHLLTLCAVLMLASTTLHADALDDCRSARHGHPAQALTLCAQALASADHVDAAFEARMHLIELNTASGALDVAEELLQDAERELIRVSDPLARHRLLRRRGLLAYRRNDFGLALAHFLEALAVAKALPDARAMAVSENDLGVAYRRLGDDPQALSHWLASLEAKHRDGDTDLAATENNIGNLYRDLNEPEQAAIFLQRALAGHLAHQRVLLAAHTREDIGLLAADRKDWPGARSEFDQAWEVYLRENAWRDQLRLSRHRAEQEWLAADADATRAWVARAQALATRLDVPLPADMDLLNARLLAAGGRYAEAMAHLDQREALLKDADAGLLKDWRSAQADWAAALARPMAALEFARAAHAAEIDVLRRRHGERMDALRARFEFVEIAHERDRLQRTNAEQALTLQQRRNQLLGLGLLSVVVLAGLSAFFQRRLYRQRLRLLQIEAEQRAQAEEARRVAESLRADLRSVRVALDQTAGPVLVVDAAGVVRLANAAAADHLQRSEQALRGQTLSSLFGDEAAAQLQSALESLTSGEAESPLSIHSGPANALRIRALSLSLEEELGVLSLENGAPAPEWVDTMNRAHAQWEQHDAQVVAVDTSANSAQDARAGIVSLMQACVDAWERSTRSTRLELAEKSGIWRITIDDGRLRTRTLNRYLDLASLPARPRWREVLRTAYFILAECTLDAEQRVLIEQSISTLQARMRASPLDANG